VNFLCDATYHDFETPQHVIAIATVIQMAQQTLPRFNTTPGCCRPKMQKNKTTATNKHKKRNTGNQADLKAN
jgi:hypothetical protein